MRRLVQLGGYADPADAESLSEEPVVIHQRSEVTENTHLVIFVHGLGGNRYGKRTTWGDFPRMIFADLPGVDVGMYQYRTGAGRLFSSKSVPVASDAEVFAGVVRDELRDYASIILIGHSMGGLLSKAMIRHLVVTDDETSLERIEGLILMATPQLGSLRMPAFLSLFSRDAQALKPHSELVTQINRTFEDHIALDESISTERKTTIPTWAVEGVHDRWVDPLSSGIGLPSSRRKIVRGSHTSIVKPRDRNAPTYEWVKSRIEISLHRFRYDVFVAAVMAGHPGDAEYAQSRADVLSIVEVLKKECGFGEVFYAGQDLTTMKDFDPTDFALKIDLKAMRSSRYFLLYYPEKVVSSVLYEAGWALVLGKPSIYIVTKDEELPFLLNDAGQAFDNGRVRIFECKDIAAVRTRLARYGNALFDSRAD